MRIGLKINPQYVETEREFFLNVIDDVLHAEGADYINEYVEKEIQRTLNARHLLIKKHSDKNWANRPAVAEWYSFYSSILCNVSIVVGVYEFSQYMTRCPVSPDGYVLACERHTFVYDLMRDRR